MAAASVRKEDMNALVMNFLVTEVITQLLATADRFV